MRNTIFFDIGGVLVFFSLEKMKKNLSTLCQAELRQDFFDEHILINSELGKTSSFDLYEVLLDRYDLAFGYNHFVEAFCEIFSPNQEISPLLYELKKNHKLVLLSNTSAPHFDHLHKTYPILKLFDDKILSYEVGFRKPDANIYKLALQKAEGKAIYIDDLEENVQGAKDSGLNAILYEGVDNLTKSLKENDFL